MNALKLLWIALVTFTVWIVAIAVWEAAYDGYDRRNAVPHTADAVVTEREYIPASVTIVGKVIISKPERFRVCATVGTRSSCADTTAGTYSAVGVGEHVRVICENGESGELYLLEVLPSHTPYGDTL